MSWFSMRHDAARFAFCPPRREDPLLNLERAIFAYCRFFEQN